MKLYRQTSSPTQIGTSPDWRDERIPAQFNGPLIYPEMGYSCGAEASSSSSLMESSSKGNQQLNDELRVKADELEKLFAEHKRRVYDNQLASSRRGRLEASLQMDLVPEDLKEGSSSSNGVEFDGNDDQGFGSEYCKGRWYESYMERRDARLKESWGSKRAEMEVRMRALQESIEESWADIKARFGIHSEMEIDEQATEFFRTQSEEDPNEFSERVWNGRDKPFSDTLSKEGSTASIHSERFSSNTSIPSSRIRNSITTVHWPPLDAKSNNWQQSFEPLESEDEEGQQQLYEPVRYRRNNSYSTTMLTAGSLAINNSKKLLSSKSVSSSTARISAPSPVPKTTVKGTNTGPIRRKSNSSSHPSQPNPNSADVRKENTKPSNGTSKVASSSQPRSFPRSKSTNVATNVFDEEKARKSGTHRKSSAGESKDISSLSTSSAKSKPFLRKGNGIAPGAGAGVAKRKASIASEIPKNIEESQALVSRREDSKPYMSRDEDESIARDFLAESAGESPGSWRSQVHSPFSYAHDATNFESSMGSPMGSPASWNMHPLSQMREADSARTRKKWGTVETPFNIPEDSHQTSKDAPNRFKRLLSFGRRSRGAESMSSEVNDEAAEYSHDHSNRSREASRMSRMGQQVSAYDGADAKEIYTEEAPFSPSSIWRPLENFKPRDDHPSGSPQKAARSFFSLPSFRNRGSESRLRC